MGVIFMELSNELVSEFVKMTKDDTKTENTTLYGTVVTSGGEKCVQIDGSTIPTPIVSTVSLSDGDRVSVVIENHIAMVTGNISDVSASSSDLEDLGESVETSISELEDSISLKVSKGSVISEINLSSEEAKISASKVNIEGAVTFSSFGAELQADYNAISGNASEALSTANDASETADDAMEAAEDAQSTADGIVNNIYTRNTTTIDGGKITTGTIDAEKIDVDDLFAQNITASGNIYFSNGKYVLASTSKQFIRSSNLSTYFTVTNNTYYFAANNALVSKFTSNNNGVASSTAQTKLVAKSRGILTFDYSYSTESGSDKFTIISNGYKEVNGVSGIGSGSLTLSLNEGDNVIFRYIKNSSINDNDDECIVSNMYFYEYDGDDVIFQSKVGDNQILAHDELLLRGENGVNLISGLNDVDIQAYGKVVLTGGRNGVYIYPGTDEDDTYASPYGTYYRVLTTKDIDYGEATATYGTSTKYKTVYFNKTFTSKPKVITSQVFDSTNVVVKEADIYTDHFVASIPALTSSGTRVFSWMAIGK